MSNPHKGHTGLDRLLRATGHSWSGLATAYREESAFRQEVWAAALLVPAALWLGRNPMERSLLIAAVLVVLLTELLNSGIEAAIDRISYDEHPLAKRAKDYGSAAVLLALLICLMVWLVVACERWIA